MLKIFINTCITVVMWWLVGYGIGFGDDSDNAMVGHTNFVG